MKNIIMTIIKIFIVQILFFLLPLYTNNLFIEGATFTINIILTWVFIKDLEKEYYKKYNKVSSILYMSCPLVGIIILMLLLNKYIDKIFINYYIYLFIGIFILNILYIIRCLVHKK